MKFPPSARKYFVFNSHAEILHENLNPLLLLAPLASPIGPFYLLLHNINRETVVILLSQPSSKSTVTPIQHLLLLRVDYSLPVREERSHFL